MGKNYKEEFKLMIVKLLLIGKSIKSVSKEYHLNNSMIAHKRII